MKFNLVFLKSHFIMCNFIHIKILTSKLNALVLHNWKDIFENMKWITE